jgi:hypothetical protein
MNRTNHTMPADLLADPFAERIPLPKRRVVQLLGGQFRFESNSRSLLRLVDSAFARLPRHRLAGVAPRLTVRLWLKSSGRPHLKRHEPPPLEMFSGAGFLGGATQSSNFVVLSPKERTALVVVSPQMAAFPYHTRYELIEFAVFTLAARAQGLVSLHAACVGRGGRGVLLMGPSGAGKSTVALQALLQGFDFVAEDSVFMTPETLLATGVANFLHVRADSLRWIERDRDARAIRTSPVIRRRSGVRKFEVDLRRGHYRLAPAPLEISALVFLSPSDAAGGPLLRPLTKSSLLRRFAREQRYAVNQPEWAVFSERIAGVDAFELRRGRHPLEAVEALGSLVGRRMR